MKDALFSVSVIVVGLLILGLISRQQTNQQQAYQSGFQSGIEWKFDLLPSGATYQRSRALPMASKSSLMQLVSNDLGDVDRLREGSPFNDEPDEFVKLPQWSPDPATESEPEKPKPAKAVDKASAADPIIVPASSVGWAYGNRYGSQSSGGGQSGGNYNATLYSHPQAYTATRGPMFKFANPLPRPAPLPKPQYVRSVTRSSSFAPRQPRQRRCINTPNGRVCFYQ